MLWTYKYAPKDVQSFAGNEDARLEAQKWALEVDKGTERQKPLLIFGPPGTGKTALAHALAVQMGWEVIESDASRLRSADDIKQVLGISSSYGSLYGTKRLVIVDEVGTTSDRGSTQAMAALAKESTQPLIFIANDEWDDAVKPLRFLCRPIELKKVNSRSVEKRLREIALKEGMADGEYIHALAASSNGDMRAAIIDLQAFGVDAAGVREREAGIFDAVRKVLKAQGYDEALKAADGVDEDISMIVAWLCENVPAEYENPAEVALAYDRLSRASMFLGMVFKSGDYGFWRYARAMALTGTALAKEKPYYKYAKYSFPTKISKMSSSRAHRNALKSAAKKAGGLTHASARRSQKDTLPFLSAYQADCMGLGKDEQEAVADTFGKLAAAPAASASGSKKKEKA